MPARRTCSLSCAYGPSGREQAIAFRQHQAQAEPLLFSFRQAERPISLRPSVTATSTLPQSAGWGFLPYILSKVWSYVLYAPTFLDSPEGKHAAVRMIDALAQATHDPPEGWQDSPCQAYSAYMTAGTAHQPWVGFASQGTSSESRRQPAFTCDSFHCTVARVHGKVRIMKSRHCSIQLPAATTRAERRRMPWETAEQARPETTQRCSPADFSSHA